MKRTGFLWMILLTLFLCSCAAPAPSETTGAAETPSAATQPGQADENTFPEVLECAAATGFVTQKSIDTNTPCPIRLTKNRQQNAPSPEAGCNLCIEIDTGDALLKKELASGVIPLAQEHSLSFGDVDGNGVQEIFIHHNTGGVGGFGLWQTWILKVEDNAISILFENFDTFDTGFESRFLDGYQLEVKNRFTGYTLVFDIKQTHKDYIDNTDTLPGDSIVTDPFYVFAPEDVDGDNISEVICKQFTSIFSHADYTGTACSVLKWDPEAQAFEVIDAWYEPNTEQ